MADLTEASAQAAGLLASMEWIDLDRYSVVGTYLRFDHRTRSNLKEFRQKIVGSLGAMSLHPKNFLIWGAPGTGKSYLVQQIARSVGAEADYVELNLAQLTQEELRDRLGALASIPRPVVCLVDEIDARKGDRSPYETLLPYLEPSVPRSSPTCYCLAGSGGEGIDALKESIRSRAKGTDLLSRVPRGNEVALDPLGVGDRVLVAVVQLRRAAAEEGREVREVEKLAMYYLAIAPGLASARQLRDIAFQAAQRMPRGEDRLRYDYLFPAGDPENKEFWGAALPLREALAGRFVAVQGGATREGGGATDRREAGPTVAAERRAPGARWLAVLPFASFSPDPADEYFADGITEELISAVARLDGLNVISRTSVMTYKGRSVTARVIGKELGVSTLVEGSVRKSGNHVRVSAQLIDVGSDRPTWSETYDRDLSDILAIQGDIAHRVAEAARGRVVDQIPESSPAGSPARAAAHAFYLKGRFFWNRATKEWLEKALVQFQNSIGQDPTYALGYSGLADTYLMLGRRGDAPVDEVYPRAIANAQRALALNPNLAEPHAALGSIRQEHEWKWAESEREFRRALELKPGAATTHAWYGLFLGHVGRFDEAVAEAAKAVELDPFSPRMRYWASEEFVFARRFPEALESAERALEIDPQYGPGEYSAGIALSAMGQFDEAIDRFDRANRLFGGQSVDGRLGHAHALAGHVDIAHSLARRFEASTQPHPPLNPALPPSPYHSLDAAMVHLGLGDHQAALTWFERARDQRVPEVVHYAHEPIYDPIRSEPRFRAIITSIGL